MREDLADLFDNANAVLDQIPPEHRSIEFERLMESVNPQENTRRIQLALALLWANRNAKDSDNLLTHILHGAAMHNREPSPRTDYLPKDKREWDVACLVAASLIQWLGTAAGSGFLRQAFRNAGGRLTVELPDTTGHEQPRL
jgi:hypothetical protein